MRDSILSRRDAASLIAGLLAASSTGSVAGERASLEPVGSDVGFEVTLARSRELMLGLFAKMRDAFGAGKLNDEFASFKRAFTSHGHAEAIAASAIGRSDMLRENELFRREDTAAALARVIVSELDAWPKKDAGWARRLDELERVVRERAITAA